MSDIKGYLRGCQQRVTMALEHWLPPAARPPRRLHEAMRYSVLAPGKRVRPVLLYAAGEALGVPADQLDGLACAVELIHAYSLIHDDLPAMDDDDLRRGRPTCHRQFDEATAILAGDALQPLAFQIISQDPGLQATAEARLAMIESLALASGSHGMAGGQAMDLDATGGPLNLLELENVHIHKTGALIRAAVQLGTLAAGETTPAVRDGLDHYAKCIGLAFQIRDDILDVEASPDVLGKTPGKDLAQDKTTYPALLGVSGSQQKAEELIREALSALAPLDDKAERLRLLAAYVVHRGH